MLTTQEVEQYIRLTLKQHKIRVKVEFSDYVWNVRKVCGLYCSPEKKILLSPFVLESFALFKHVFLHELAHALDHRERGDSIWNGKRANWHGAHFHKWCKHLGIPHTSKVPRHLSKVFLTGAKKSSTLSSP